MENTLPNLESCERLNREIAFFEGFEVERLQTVIPHISIRSHPGNRVLFILLSIN